MGVDVVAEREILSPSSQILTAESSQGDFRSVVYTRCILYRKEFTGDCAVWVEHECTAC